MKKKTQFYSWMNPKLEAFKTKETGMGVFAKNDIKKDEILAVFGGYVMTLKEETLLPKKISDLAHQISNDFVIGINAKENYGPSDCFNHSCEPNAGFDGQIFLVAMRDIEIGEQVTFDYAMTIGGTEPYKLECMCGLDTCRKIITNLDWKKKSLQRKYSGYFQLYIAKLINKK